MKYVAFLLIAFTMLTAGQNTIEVELSKQMILGKTKNIEAGIVHDKFDDYELAGKVKYKKMSGGNIEVKITWSQLKRDKKSVKLSDDFISEASGTEGELVDVGTSLGAKGNTLLLSEKIQSFDIESGNYSPDGSTTASTQDIADAAGLNNANDGGLPSSGGTTPTSSTNPVAPTDPSATDTTTPTAQCEDIIDLQEGKYKTQTESAGTCVITNTYPITYTTEGCTPQVDIATKTLKVLKRPLAQINGLETPLGACQASTEVVTLQGTRTGCKRRFDLPTLEAVAQEKLFYINNGATVYVTDCVDANDRYKVQAIKQYNTESCQNQVNFDTKEVSIGTRTYTVIDGLEYDIDACSWDTANPLPLQSTVSGCGVRHDFIKQVSIPQIRDYYDFQGQTVFEGQCHDTTTEYGHFKTAQTCNHQYTGVSDIIYYQRTAYNLPDGTVGYATECEPQSASLPIQKEFCGYEHAYSSQTSYRKEKSYFVEPGTTSKVYLTDCVKTSKAYLHKEEDAGYIHSDPDLTSMHQHKLYFDDADEAKRVYPQGETPIDDGAIDYINNGFKYQMISAYPCGTYGCTLIPYSGTYKSNVWPEVIIDLASIAQPVTIAQPVINTPENLYRASSTKVPASDVGGTCPAGYSKTYSPGTVVDGLCGGKIVSGSALFYGTYYFCYNPALLRVDYVTMQGGCTFSGKAMSELNKYTRTWTYERPDHTIFTKETKTVYGVFPVN